MKLPPVQHKANTVLHLIVSFAGQATEGIFCGKGSKRASKACPAPLRKMAVQKLGQLNQVGRTAYLSHFRWRQVLTQGAWLCGHARCRHRHVEMNAVTRR
jgi:hypothetical protein